MSIEFFECEQKKSIKMDLFSQEEGATIGGLCLDPASRFRYMEKLSHCKTEPNQALLKKMMLLMEKLPQKYQSYIEKALSQLEGGHL